LIFRQEEAGAMKQQLIATLTMLLLMAPYTALAMEVSLFPAAELDEFYNSNVGATANSPKGDWTTAELLGGKIEASSPHRDFFLTYATVLSENAWYQNLDSFARDHSLQLNDTELLSASTTLNVSDSFLRGNATSAQFFSGATEPITPQLLATALYNSTTESNAFSSNLLYVGPKMIAWSGEVHQTFFSTGSSSRTLNTTAGLSFDQGGSLGFERPIGERFSIGAGYQFDDFRFNNGVPSSESHTPVLRLTWGTGSPFTLQAWAGPRIVSSSSGVIGGTQFSGTTSVQPGFQVIANYQGERFSLQGSTGETSGLSAGFGGQTSNITVAALGRYKLTRRTILFANVGYLDFTGTGTSGYSLSYAVGASYRLTRQFSLTAEYYGYRTQANGGSLGTFAIAPGQTVAANVFLFGVVFQGAPWRWILD
jgi:hypothetical protein